MKKDVFKSIGAVLAGMVVGAVLSVATDKALELSGLLKTTPFDQNPAWLIVLVIVYRCIYNAAGAYVAAKLAPQEPMKHAMVLGYIGLAVSIAGTIAMWHVPPHWYPITLTILTLPSVWIGAKTAINPTSKQAIN